MQPITSPMMPRRAPRFLGAEFNRFLFAPIGTDRDGAQLSVVSALARLDLDAWAEAASLARLPRALAVSKLSARLGTFEEIPRIKQESGAIAARLIALLPGGAAPDAVPAVAAFSWGKQGGAGLLFLMMLGLLLGMQYARLVSQQPAVKGHGLSEPAGVISHTPPAPKQP